MRKLSQMSLRFKKNNKAIFVFEDLKQKAVERLARTLASLCHQGDILALKGEVGAGKSTFARAFVRTLAGRSTLEVPSPTYTLAQRYSSQKSRPPIWHIDLYRLEEQSELRELGIEDAIAEGIILVEWPDRIDEQFPKSALTIIFSQGKSDNKRTITIKGDRSWGARLSKSIKMPQ